MKTHFLLPLLATAFSSLPLYGDGEIGFIEKFALASDREKVLAELPPGTQDFFFFHALYYQSSRQKEKLTALLAEWEKQFPQSEARTIIEKREALMIYDSDPQVTLDFLKRALNLHFNHQQQAREIKRELPTELDAAKIERQVYLSLALKGNQIEQLSLPEQERLITDGAVLTPEQRRRVLLVMNHPLVPNIVSAVAADLNEANAPAFGDLNIHHLLLLDQLTELQALVPRLKDDASYVHARLSKLAPSEDEDAEFNPAVRHAWLERMWSEVKDLPSAFTYLKVRVLQHQLAHNLAQGIYDQSKFIDYLKLPRNTGNLAESWQKKLTQQGAHLANLHDSYGDLGNILPPLGDDEELVQKYLLHFFAEAAGKDATVSAEQLLNPYTEFISINWLRPVLAEAMITLVKDRPERWAEFLSATEFQSLKERVDIDFTASNKQFHRPGDDVSVELYVKNTPQLLVRVYEINTLGYYLQHEELLNTDIDVDGLVANSENTHRYDDSPFHRVKRQFDFPDLKGKRGAWLIEFIGGGRSSRALITTGQWHLAQSLSPAGDLVQVLDENYEPIKDAVAWIDGRRLEPDAKTGKILIPFTHESEERDLVLATPSGDFASLVPFQQHGEEYELDVQFYLNREQLIAGKQAALAVRTALLNNGKQQPLALLQDIGLTIRTTSLGGVESTLEVPISKLESGAEFLHEFTVPERLQAITVSLDAKVKQLSQGSEKLPLAAAHSWQINGINATEQVLSGLFTSLNGEYVFDLLGKNAEPVVNESVTFSLYREGFTQPVLVSLATDDAGRVKLGRLDGLSKVTTQVHGTSQSILILDQDNVISEWNDIQTTPEQSLQLPLAAPFKKGAYTLVEIRQATPVIDASQHLEAVDGGNTLNIKPLPPGDYVLRGHHDGTETQIKVAKGVIKEGWVFGEKRHLELAGNRVLNISSVSVEGDALVIKLNHANAFTRVHVAAERFMPAYSLFSEMGKFGRLGSAMETPAQLPNLYSTGREIGDEYRYILDRRQTQKYAGNMLTRPGLLLNPWELRESGQIGVQQQAGEKAGRTAGARANDSSAAMLRKAVAAEHVGDVGGFASMLNLDFLATAAPVLYNLKPDEQGIVRVPLSQLGDRQYIEVYTHDLANAVQRVISLSDKNTKFRDLRLAQSIDPKKSFTESKQVTVLQQGSKLTLQDATSSEMETYDSISSLFALYSTLSNNAELAKFSWILEWPELSAEDKRVKYSEFASHELSFFLSRKDKTFFDEVIKPYLVNKKEKTFMDDYLLEGDLSRYLEPWHYARLNAAEKALLGRRLPDETAKTARYLQEIWELLPPDQQRNDRLFEVALFGRVLSAPGGTSVAEREMKRKSMSPPANGAMIQPQDRKDTGDRARAMMAEIPADPFVEAAPPPAPAPAMAAAAPMSDELGGGVALNYVYGGSAQENMVSMDADSIDQLISTTRPYYRKLGPVKEWAENHYWRLPLAQQGADLIKVNAFWRDYAAWDGKGAFLSKHLTQASGSFAEIMLALGVLDLPFEKDKPKHQTDLNEKQATVTAGGTVVIYHKEIQPSQSADVNENSALLVSQSFFRRSDRFRTEGNVSYEKTVKDEFLSGVVYGANVVVTNPSSTPVELDLLLQIPQGAIPVFNTRETFSQHLRLEAYNTKTFEYSFYFPVASGEGKAFTHHPVDATMKGKLAALADAVTFKVVDTPSKEDTESWEYVSQYGSEESVLAYLDKANLQRLDVTRVAWRCREKKDFYLKLSTLLKARHRYDSTVFSYALYHQDKDGITEFLKHQDSLVSSIGAWLSSPLLSVDPIVRRSYEHLEYSPLVNQRIHQIGAERKIVTPEQFTQYHRLLDILAYKPSLDAVDRLSITYHLFLQDRVEEALAILQSIKREDVATSLQYDYLQCYAALYTEQLAEARAIATKYTSYPVPRWQERFVEVLDQLNEIEGKDMIESEAKDREKSQSALATKEPSLDFKVEKGALQFGWRNLTKLTVNYYLMDPEFAFSNNPFSSENTERFTILKPNHTAVVDLPNGQNSLSQALAEEYSRANLMVEVLGAGLRKTHSVHANNLKLELAENYGRLQVRDRGTDKVLSKTYVKVYARLQDGTVRFFKDGYTDLRGRFDYSSLNSPLETPLPPIIPLSHHSDNGNGLNHQTLQPGELALVDKLSILVLSDSHGAEIREVNPPGE